ncbi:hypothetical protein [Streptacidiphilus sp. EB129]|uniref:hypothetical protein n=1 Tax=Streptacidiphilus sp. EB129 TaxID=3156262 RepID=UPI003516B2E2
MNEMRPFEAAELGVSRHPLTAPQDFRVRVARNDLERARQLELGGAPAAELLLIVGALTSSLYNVLQLVGDLAEVTE